MGVTVQGKHQEYSVVPEALVAAKSGEQTPYLG